MEHLFDSPVGIETIVLVLGVHASTRAGFGEDMRVASNAAPAGRQRNRRVEAWIAGGTP